MEKLDFFPHKGESELAYLWRIGNYKNDHILDISWAEISDIMNDYYGAENGPCGESKYRKDFATALKFYNEIFSKSSDERVEAEFQEQRRELEQLKTEFRDERNAWAKQNRDSARMKETLDILERELTEVGRKEFPGSETRDFVFNYSDDLIVLLSDFHIGENFDNFYGKYNSDVASDRLGRLKEQVLDLKRTLGSQVCHIFCLGDMVSGNFRRSIQVTNKENVIDQIKIATELISNFCYDMCMEFNEVNFQAVAGNHSRFVLDKNADITDERMDDIITWAVKLTMSNVKNFTVNDGNIDNSLAIADIRGKMYCLAHGDDDSFSKNGAYSLASVLGCVPYAICMGHRHTPAFQDADGVKMIQSGCLCGSGDNYTRSKRLRSPASQVVLSVNEAGINGFYPINLQ